MNKFSNRQFFLFGINYIVGFGFIATVSTLIVSGSYGFLIFGVASFIGLVVALSFSKLSQKYPKTVGGSFAYSKYAFGTGQFGRGMRFLQGWNQYLKGPISSSSSPLFLASIVSTFDTDTSHQVYYIIGSIVLFSLLTVIATFGLKRNKYIIFTSASIKWLVIFGAVILLIYSVINGIINNETNIGMAFKSTPLPKLSILLANIVSFVYAFGGIETLGTISREAKVKNFRKMLLVVFALILTFYITLYMLFITVPSLSLDQTNTPINAFSRLYETTLGITGLILFSIGIFFNRITALSSSIYSSSREVVAISEAGYFPQILTRKNKHGEYRNTIFVAAFVNIITMILFAIMPNFLFPGTQASELFANVIIAGVLFFLTQYFLTLITALVLNYRGQIKLNILEHLLYYLGIIVIFTIIIGTMFPPIFNLIDSPIIIREEWDAKQTVLVASYFGLLALGFVIWFLKSIFSRGKVVDESEFEKEFDDEKTKEIQLSKIRLSFSPTQEPKIIKKITSQENMPTKVYTVKNEQK